MIYNRQWLRDQLASYMRDPNMGSVQDTFINIACTRLGVMLQSQYNEFTVQRTLSAASYPLEEDMVSFRLVEYNGDGGPYALTGVPSHRVNDYTGDGMPRVYGIKGNNLVVAPFTQGLFDLTFYARVILGDDTSSTNAALQGYPFLFLSATLQAAYEWKQDEGQANRYEQKWMQEVAEINKTSSLLNQGDAPAMRAI